MSKKTNVALIAIFVVVCSLVAMRFFSGEDAWLCQNGQWVKHGNPSAAKPAQDCGSPREKTTAEQITQILSTKYNKPASGMVVGVLTDTGNFAKGTYNEPEAGGGLWFAAKTAQGWQLAYDGNGIIPCDAANKYSLPKDMAPQCIDTKNNNNLINR